MRSQLELSKSDLKAISCLFLIFFLALRQACSAQNPDEENIIKTKKLLEQFHREIISAVMVFPEESIIREIERIKSKSELLTLYDRKDPSVMVLGSFWAEICQTVDSSMCTPGLIRDLENENPKVKAFACENLAVLKPQSAVLPLRVALEDHEIVPGYSGETEVAVFAATALASFGYADGIDAMLTNAEKQGEYWYLSYENIFEQLSGQKFPRDLELWREWFRDHKSQLKYTAYIFR